MKRRLICFLLLLLLVFQVSANATEIVDLTYLGGVENFDPMTDHTRQIILEELGVNIIAEMGNEPEKVNLILMSG